MKKIILNGNVVDKLVPESLPMLIHGLEGSGASLYTICLAANWFVEGYKIMFLCGYKMAEEQFSAEIKKAHPHAQFYTKEHAEDFVDDISEGDLSKTIIFVKNIELFDSYIFDLVMLHKNVVISGNIEKVTYKESLLKEEFATKVFYSPLSGYKFPTLAKYKGFVMSKDSTGITELR